VTDTVGTGVWIYRGNADEIPPPQGKIMVPTGFAAFPKELAGLAPPDRYAAVELFRGTMLRHSAVVYRDTAQAAAQRIDFSGDAFAAYVPIRAPHTLSVRERLPPGAAAVLINRSHAHTDIFLPIDAREERLLAAADGQRSIAEIAGSPASLPATGAFFERLYAHDQVVFDASAPRAAR